MDMLPLILAAFSAPLALASVKVRAAHATVRKRDRA